MRKYATPSRCLMVMGVVACSAILLSAPRKAIPFTKWDRAFYAKPNVVAFVRPGFAIQIVSAKIAADGTVTVDYKISDPKGLPLDFAGIQTPGTIAVSFVLAHMTKGSTQFTTYATRSRTSTDGKTTVTQASADSGGKSTPIAEGEYLYTFGNKVPAGSDATVTHRLAMYGSRNLTEFDLGTFYDDAVLDWVPAGGKPAPRDVVRTDSCNKCHDQLAAHGGSRRSVEVCVICHTAQTTEPTRRTPLTSRSWCTRSIWAASCRA